MTGTEGATSVLRQLAIALIGLVALSMGCSNVNPYYDPNKPHHTQSGFTNDYAPDKPNGGDFLRWRWDRWWNNLPKPPAEPIRPVEPNLAFIQNNEDEVAVTWIGHATVLLQVGGLNVLTDPQFSDRASPVSFAGPPRHQRPGVALEDLPRIDAVVISHAHYDHLDLASVKALYQQDGGPPRFFLPLGMDQWFMKSNHVTPEESVQAMQDVGARKAMAIHWGTFEDLSDEPLDESPKRLARAREAAGLLPEDFRILSHGEIFQPGSR